MEEHFCSSQHGEIAESVLLEVQNFQIFGVKGVNVW